MLQAPKQKYPRHFRGYSWQSGEKERLAMARALALFDRELGIVMAAAAAIPYELRAVYLERLARGVTNGGAVAHVAATVAARLTTAREDQPAAMRA
jgi:hypothetical protein